MLYGDPEHQIGLAFLTNKMYLATDIHSPQFARLFKSTYDIVNRQQT